MKIICWWSGGVTSMVACLIIKKKHPDALIRYIFIDTENEDEDTYRFKKDCEKMLGAKIETIKTDKYESIQDVWIRHKSLNTANGAICSSVLKQKVRQEWEKSNEWDHQVFGFHYSKREMKRAKSLSINWPKINPLFPLIENKIDKKQSIEQLAGKIELPRAYQYGFENNNCFKTGCVQGGVGYYKKMKKDFPEKFNEMAKMEHKITKLKGEPVTILKDQSKAGKGNLVFLKKHQEYPDLKSIDDMTGREPKNYFECMGFCGINDLLEV